jgi:tripartite-type tricarboxylate transporter receptor subunit TctC
VLQIEGQPFGGEAGGGELAQKFRFAAERALAVTGSARMAQLPDVPTIAEAGVRDYDGLGFLGIAVRTGTPQEVIDVLNREINRALASPEISKHIASNGLVAGGGAPGDFGAFLARDKAIWTKVIATGGIKAE